MPVSMWTEQTCLKDTEGCGAVPDKHGDIFGCGSNTAVVMLLQSKVWIIHTEDVMLLYIDLDHDPRLSQIISHQAYHPPLPHVTKILVVHFKLQFLYTSSADSLEPTALNTSQNLWWQFAMYAQWYSSGDCRFAVSRALREQLVTGAGTLHLQDKLSLSGIPSSCSLISDLLLHLWSGKRPLKRNAAAARALMSNFPSTLSSWSRSLISSSRGDKSKNGLLMACLTVTK